MKLMEINWKICGKFVKLKIEFFLHLVPELKLIKSIRSILTLSIEDWLNDFINDLSKKKSRFGVIFMQIEKLRFSLKK